MPGVWPAAPTTSTAPPNSFWPGRTRSTLPGRPAKNFFAPATAWATMSGPTRTPGHVRVRGRPELLLGLRQVQHGVREGRLPGRVEQPAEVVGVGVRHHDRRHLLGPDPGRPQVGRQLPHAGEEGAAAGVDQDALPAGVDQQAVARQGDAVGRQERGLEHRRHLLGLRLRGEERLHPREGERPVARQQGVELAELERVDGGHDRLAGRRRRREAVADPRLVDDQRRVAGVGFEFQPQPADRDPQIVELALLAGTPDLAEQSGVGHDPVGLGGEQSEDAVLLRGDVNVLPGAADATAGEVHLDLPDRHHLALAHRAQPVAQRRADAGEQLLGVERLGEIIVGAEIERGDLLVGTRACRYDQRRRPVALTSPISSSPSRSGSPRSSSTASGLSMASAASAARASAASITA